MTQSNYEYSISSTEETGLRVLSLKNKKTGIVVNTIIPNNETPVASVVSYVASRYSRSDKSVVDLLNELVEKKTDAVSVMGKIFRAYGHASVADMAYVFVYIENIPSLYASRFFMETNVGAGMERSTRYQDFGKISEFDTIDHYLEDLPLDGAQKLNQVFQDCQKTSHQLYTKWNEKLFTIFQNNYQVDVENKTELAALKARTFDSARAFLPWGGFNKTSLGYVTSAREWSRLIGTFKGIQDPILQEIGEMLEELLAPSSEAQQDLNILPEVDDLIRYTQAEETFETNSVALKNWLHSKGFKYEKEIIKVITSQRVTFLPEYFRGSEKLLFSYMVNMFPDCCESQILNFIRGLTTKDLMTVGQLIFKNHNQHNQLPNIARTGDYWFILDCAYSEMRDLNRHRSFGRYCPWVMNSGKELNASKGMQYILPLYIEALENELRNEFVTDILAYQSKIAFAEVVFTRFPSASFLIKQLWLFSMKTPLVMLGGPKEIHYLIHLRIRPGGHINYRQLSKMIGQKLQDIDPMLSSILPENDSVDPLSSKEFKDRS
ncbi:MAG: FAD-dependent thymidylate synthase [Patescibacteria group bacterium]